MNRVDRIVVETGNGQTTITGPALVKKIVNATMVADSPGYNVYYNENYIRCYRGEKLVREMRQSSNYPEVVRIYMVDRRHFHLFHNDYKEGTVTLPAGLLDEIKAALAADGNSYANINE